jgi:hypothetical protein
VAPRAPKQTEAWQQTTVPKLSPAIAKSFGQVKHPERRFSFDTSQGRHATCVDHLTVEGLHDPVCVRRGEDPDVVRREALELAGVRS